MKDNLTPGFLLLHIHNVCNVEVADNPCPREKIVSARRHMETPGTQCSSRRGPCHVCLCTLLDFGAVQG